MQTDFVINDQANGYPTRRVKTTVTRAEADQFVVNGYLPLKGLIGAELASELGASVLEVAEAEAEDVRSEVSPGQSIYIRGLFDKDAIFHQLLRLEPALSMARTLLGPQLWVELEARMNYEDRAGVAVPWHGHLPVIPDPLPPLFCYPHQVHCLIYLDPVTEREGALCLIPGSHMRPDIRIPLGDRSDQPGQVKLFFEPGDAVLIHANVWHQTVLSQSGAGPRRLLLIGYVPAWIRNDGAVAGVRPEHKLTEELARDGDQETRELLGEFRW
jgi:ectoine hydroxylase-related dioxygenase (phytanoyl-CoA dioxygenase family)